MFPMLAILASSHATVPLPTYPQCGEIDRPDLCPMDLGEEWSKISYVPVGSRNSIREAELEIGSGVHADKAWRVTTGRWDVVLAVADSGISWNNDQLARKVWLDTGELPLPQYADGSEAKTHDLDGNGLVNVTDYALDPRVLWDAGRDAADAMLDPSDLIYTFSDGVDDDADGYVDDIAGWDFFGRDNDPYAELDTDNGTHGDGVLEEVGAEGDDADNDIGTCPNCAILPVRIGSTFVVDGGRAGEGIAFAVDQGAAVVNLSVGALSSPDVQRDAVAYAEAMGVSLVGAAGDENAYHPNDPAELPEFLFVHSIRADNANEDGDAYSYLNAWNCNNYGPRLDLVAPSTACATGAVAQTTAVIGLVHSAARDLGLTLSPAEIRHLLQETADDVWLTEEELAISGAYPSAEGWDAFFGYGRINAERAIDWVTQGKIPPTIRLDAPRWFDHVAQKGSDITLTGRIAAERSPGFHWMIEVGQGHEPATWTEVGSGDATGPIEGDLGTIDTADLAAVTIDEPIKKETILQRMDRVFEPAVTIRITVTDDAGVPARLRRTLFYQPDADLLDGFPLDLGVSAEASPIVADLDGDDIFEIIVAASNGTMHALDGTGTELPGFPVAVDDRSDGHTSANAFVGGGLQGVQDSFLATPAVGDLDADGVIEIVGATLGGGVYAWHTDGTRMAGFPVWAIGRTPEEIGPYVDTDEGFASAPTLEDLDGDGTLEIIVAGLDARLYVFDASGADFGPYPIEVCHPQNCGWAIAGSITSPAVGDVDGDGDFDLGIGTAETANDGKDSVSYLFDALTGTLHDGWPHEVRGLVNEAAILPVVGTGHPASMAFADVDGDGDLEISDPVMLGQTDIVHMDGTTALDIPYTEDQFGEGNNADSPSMVLMSSQPAFGDLNQDGTPDVLMGGASSLYLASLFLTNYMDFQHAVGAWSGKTGEFFAGWPRQIEDLMFLSSPAIADVSGDGKPEAIFGSAGYLLYAWDSKGDLAKGWPKNTGQWVLGSPAVADVTGDGYLDVVVTTRQGFVFAWSTDGAADVPVEWQSIHHDARNSGNYEVALPTQPGPELEATGCCNKDGEKTAWVVLVPILLTGLRRRVSRSSRTDSRRQVA